MAAEVTVGLLAHSLALLSDAAHMLTDAAAIALALTAMRLSARPPGRRVHLRAAPHRDPLGAGERHHAAAAVGVADLRGGAPPDHPGPGGRRRGARHGAGRHRRSMSLAARLTARADRRSLNVEGAFRHILTDAYAFVATAVAGLIMIITGFDRADAIASLVVVALMAKAGSGPGARIGPDLPRGGPGRAVARGRRPGHGVPRRAWWRCTTCTSGRSPRDCPPPPRTSSSARGWTATPCAPTWSDC